MSVNPRSTDKSVRPTFFDSARKHVSGYLLSKVRYTGGKNSSKQLAGLESFCREEKYDAPFGLLITQQESGTISDNVLAVPAAALLSVL